MSETDDLINAQIRADLARKKDMKRTDLTSESMPLPKLESRLYGVTPWKAHELEGVSHALGYESVSALLAAAERSAGLMRAN
ncbi:MULTISPECIES: hypothetical protein [unclassified Luteococcus]|uniref:hypothetical protein n=1 Tax=unclassified Luteococcus TaxID=2639923 RepID=UPI00313D8ADB